MGNKKYVAYVGTYTHGNSKGIQVYDVDVENGQQCITHSSFQER